MIVGHDAFIRDLKKLAEKRRLTHGYIFFGPEGVGKYLVAQGLANYLEQRVFDAPQKVLTDCLVVKPNSEGTIGVDVVREVKYFLWQTPLQSFYRTLIVRDADRLTDEAQNALLKITEEPPASSLVLLVVKEPELLHPTLSSRFQKIYFPTFTQTAIHEWLSALGVPAKEALVAAKNSFGAPGRAWAFLNDTKFRKFLASVVTLLKSSPYNRREQIKKILEPEDFNFREFLDALLVATARSGVRTKSTMNFWHALAELRRREEYFNLNPRLQLQALLMLHDR